jgi:hypothetical protein
VKKVFWGSWLLLTTGLAAYYGYMMWFGEDKSQLLIGETTYGHYQIEMSCSTCHTSPFGGKEVLQNACIQCHGEELEMVNDSHPKQKFTDPRNADLLDVIDARYCISCHTEHHKDKTLAMGLTLPADYCYHCHEEVGENRESHKGMAFDSCASAGCHNFHDNRALYEGFLLRHADEPVYKEIARIPARTGEQVFREKNPDIKALTIADVDLTSFKGTMSDEITHEWVASAHGRNGVECKDCHTNQSQAGVWVEKPGHKQCQTCHQPQVKGFLEGKHGMRLAETVADPLPAITPRESDLEFKEDSFDTNHSCTACHGAHDFNTVTAAVESCLGCHNDEHSLAFTSSPHFGLLQKELSGELPENSGVSCATCHMHREKVSKRSDDVFVVHNQNLTLRPNEKMIRPVCMNCHGLGFAIDALADEELIRNNFNGQPKEHIRSIDMAVERDKR